LLNNYQRFGRAKNQSQDGGLKTSLPIHPLSPVLNPHNAETLMDHILSKHIKTTPEATTCRIGSGNANANVDGWRPGYVD